ncbi:nucleotidyltransferase domain-containing protein [Thermococcus sp.]
MRSFTAKDKYNDEVISTMSEKIIRDVILRECNRLGLKVDEVILFGSRARGDFRTDSDWDVLVVLSEPSGRKKELEAYKIIHRELLLKGIRTDLLFISKEELERVKDDTGFVYYYALREGVKI